VFFIRHEARQAVKDANLDEFELACLMAEIFPYHGWKEDVASKHINKRTGERFTRQNIQYALERVKKKVRDVYLNPPENPVENPIVDKFFDEWSAEKAD
jgi:isocitrate dehydrogenase